MFAKYRHEFGQRWNALTPRNEITRIVWRFHAATPAEQIANRIKLRCQNAQLKDQRFTDAIVAESVRYALIVHARNRDLFIRVTSGRI